MKAAISMPCCAIRKSRRIWRTIDIEPGKTHLTAMNDFVRFSVKGQVVIPKDVRERYAFRAGDLAEMVQTPEGVLLETGVWKSRHGRGGAEGASGRRILRWAVDR